MKPWEEFQTQEPSQSGPWTEFQKLPDDVSGASAAVDYYLASHPHQEGKARFEKRLEQTEREWGPSTAPTSLKDVLTSQLQLPGKILGATFGQAAAYPEGIVQSVIGRPMAHGLHGVGNIVGAAPNVKPPEEIYELIKEDVAGAPSVLGARGAVTAPAKTFRKIESALYKGSITPSGNAIPVNPVEFQYLADDIANALHVRNLRRSNVKGVYDEIDELATASGNKAPDLNELLAQRQRINKFTFDKKTPLNEREAGKDVIKMIDQKIEDVVRSNRGPGSADQLIADIKEANFRGAQFHQGKRVEKATEEAQKRAGRSGTGGNLYNTLMQEFGKVAKSPLGMTEAEQAVASRLSEGTTTRNMLRLIGRLDPTAGAIQMGAHVGAYVPSGGWNVPVAIGGWVARHLGERLALKDANRLAELIASRDPSTMRLSGPMQEWATAGQAFKDDPAAKNLGRLMIATRNFSHNLKDFGITISPNELLKSIQGTVPGRTEDEKQ